MCSTMTTRTTRRITFIGLGELDVPGKTGPPSPFLPLTVSWFCSRPSWLLLTPHVDAKQARDLVSVLTESKQVVDPRLMEMARYSGGGGGGRGYGGGRGRGGGGGGRGGGFTASNAAPLGRSSRW
jgi:uncharacterized membrane protein YgcG